jgi:hypothetical protein
MSRKLCGHPSQPEISMSSKPRDIGDMLSKLHELSQDNWTTEHKKLWKEYIQRRRSGELSDLESLGHSEKDASKLVRLAWVRKCQDSGRPIVERLPSGDPARAVPVLMVFRGEEFEIEWVIRSYLNYHPLFRDHEERFSPGDAKDSVLRLIGQGEMIAESLGFDLKGLSVASEAVPDNDRKNRRAADFGDAAYDLVRLLGLQFGRYSGEENPGWLLRAQREDRFWQLLHSAILMGQAMERCRVLDELDADLDFIRKATAPRGKNQEPFGVALEKMLEAYTWEQESVPEPLESRQGSPPIAGPRFSDARKKPSEPDAGHAAVGSRVPRSLPSGRASSARPFSLINPIQHATEPVHP